MSATGQGRTSAPPLQTRLRELSAGMRRDAWMPVAIAAFLTILMVAFGGKRALDQVGPIFLANTICAYAISASMVLGYTLVVPSLSPEGRHPAVRLLIHGLAVATFTSAGVGVSVVLSDLLAPSLGFTFIALIRVALPVSVVITAVSLSFDALRDRSEEADRRKVRAEHQLLRAELEALKARVQPHFLFNSLNTVANLIEEDPVAAERAVLELSALFRYTLEGSKKAWVPLRDEVEAARRYLDFERLRFEDRLRVEIDVDEAVLDTPVPPLLLQPLVENAVTHGIGMRKDGGRIAIVGRKRSGMIELRIEDDGPGPNGSSHVGSRTTTVDLKRRLALTYGERASFDAARSDLGGFVARLELPTEALDVARSAS